MDIVVYDEIILRSYPKSPYVHDVAVAIYYCPAVL